MRRGKLFGVIAISIIVVAIAWLSSRQLHAPDQALSVSFVGYTNLPDGKRAAVFVFSNQWAFTLKQWAGVYVERTPFAPVDNPSVWTEVTNPVWDRYLKPGETVRVPIHGPFPDQEWRLRVNWSPGIRARISVATRKHSMLPDFLKNPGTFFAKSDSVPP